MISIIVPIYKTEKYLERCITSVMKQTYPNLQIILVDDGSPDNCGNICDIYQKKDKRITVIHKQNGGLSDARNAGLNVARGEYIGFVDSDDFIHPHMFEILLENLLKTASDISVCGFYWVNEGEEILLPENNETTVYEDEKILYQLIENNVITVVTWNKLYKKELFNNDKFEIGRLHEDEFMIHKLLIKTKRIVYTNAQLYNYMKHQDSIVSRKTIKNFIDTVDALEDRCLCLESIDEKVYSLTALQQIDIVLQNYFGIQSRDNKILRRELFELCRKRRYDARIWKDVPKNRKRELKLFLFSPNLYLCYRKLQNLRVR